MTHSARILIADYDSPTEALALRAVLENFGAFVSILYIGRPNDFLSILRDESDIPFDYVLFTGHGEDGSFLLPSLHESVYTPGEPRRAIDPEIIRENLRLTGRIILSTACTTGLPETAAAFTEKGNIFLGPTDYIEGTSCFYFAVSFFYQRLVLGRSPAEAARIAASTDTETGLFGIYGE